MSAPHQPHPHTYWQPQPQPRNGLGIAALVLGICGILSGIIPLFFWFALIAGVIGLVLGLVGWRRASKGAASNRKTAMFGTILSIGAVAMGIWGATILFQATDKFVNDMNAVTAPPVSAPAAPAAVEAPTAPTVEAPASVESVPTFEAPAVPTYTAPTYEAPKAAPAPEKKAAPELSVSRQNAVSSAGSYLEFSGFSRKGLIKQLEFENYSTADATYAADHVGADWSEQAAKSAKSYMSFTSFSRQGLIDQLKFEGFTAAQAKHGADSVGL